MGESIEQISLAAKNYAEALIEVAEDGKISFDKISSDLLAIKETFDESEDLREVLINPAITDADKINIINSIFSGKIDEYLLNFLKVLILKKRISEFNSICEDFTAKLNDIHNIQPVKIISAVELSDTYKKAVVDKLNAKLGKTVQPLWILDEDIIAGLMIKINDDVIDMSLKNRIDKLSKNLMLK